MHLPRGHPDRARPALHSRVPVAIDVLFPLPIGALTYLPPLTTVTGAVDSSTDDAVPHEARIGTRVVVPWQSSVKVGVVQRVRTVDAGRGLELRHALQYLDERPWIGVATFRGIESIARGVGAPPGQVIATLGLPGLALDLDHEVRLSGGVHAGHGAAQAGNAAANPDAEAAQELLQFVPDGARGGAWVSAAEVEGKALELLRRQGLLDERVSVRGRTRRVLLPVREPDDDLEGPRRINQRLALERLFELEEIDSAAALAREVDVPQSAVSAIITKGYAAYAEVPAEPPALAPPPQVDDATRAALPSPPFELAVPAGDGTVVGGSRLQRLMLLAERLRLDLDAGESVMVLAPEVALASEAAALLGTRLPVRLLTGDADEEQRVSLWQELPDEPPTVLVGTYPVLLAPLPNLGRVAVLEATNGAYKLRSGARLAVLKAAARLAGAVGARLTLTDVFATPELLAAVPQAERLSLPLPRLRLHVADLTNSPNWPLHPDLQLTLKQVAQRSRQAVVVVPRRGFSGAFGCTSCGWQAPCPNCDLTLRFHREETRLRCHQCGHHEAPPATCPSCGSTDLGPLRGAGTQWVLSQLGMLVPDAPLYRYDRDRRDDIAPLLEGEPGIVVGTTAALRLPPLPNLSLVAITLFDAHVALSDYRAEEDAMRMLLQVPELAGGQRPLVVVQTHAPGSETLRALGAAEPDTAVEALLGRRLERRKRFGYPPFSTLAKVQLTSRDRAAAIVAADTAADSLRVAGALDSELLGPEAAPVERLKGRYTYQLLLKVDDEERLASLLTALPKRLPGARLALDVDPSDVGELLE